jgi:hypothetical protein
MVICLLTHQHTFICAPNQLAVVSLLYISLTCGFQIADELHMQEQPFYNQHTHHQHLIPYRFVWFFPSTNTSIGDTKLPCFFPLLSIKLLLSSDCDMICSGDCLALPFNHLELIYVLGMLAMEAVRDHLLFLDVLPIVSVMLGLVC